MNCFGVGLKFVKGAGVVTPSIPPPPKRTIFALTHPILQVIIHQGILYELLSNLIGSLLLHYDFILHLFTFYGAFKLLILHGFTFFGGFD